MRCLTFPRLPNSSGRLAMPRLHGDNDALRFPDVMGAKMSCVIMAAILTRIGTRISFRVNAINPGSNPAGFTQPTSIGGLESGLSPPPPVLTQLVLCFISQSLVNLL
jgi:hypothetical protein